MGSGLGRLGHRNAQAWLSWSGPQDIGIPGLNLQSGHSLLYNENQTAGVVGMNLWKLVHWWKCDRGLTGVLQGHIQWFTYCLSQYSMTVSNLTVTSSGTNVTWVPGEVGGTLQINNIMDQEVKLRCFWYCRTVKREPPIYYGACVCNTKICEPWYRMKFAHFPNMSDLCI